LGEAEGLSLPLGVAVVHLFYVVVVVVLVNVEFVVVGCLVQHLHRFRLDHLLLMFILNCWFHPST
jgi:hypothetical protein